VAFVFIIAGTVLVIAGVRNKQGELWTLLQNDFSPNGSPQNNNPNQHSFLPWFFAILVIGALGYVEDLKPFSRAFLVLVILVLFLSNNGFFAQLQKETGLGSTNG
jgi:hypothetical protein